MWPGEEAGGFAVGGDDEQAVHATSTALEKNPTPFGRPARSAIGCLPRIAVTRGRVGKTMRLTANDRDNPDAALARVSELLSIRRPGKAGLPGLRTGKRDRPAPVRGKKDDLSIARSAKVLPSGERVVSPIPSDERM